MHRLYSDLHRALDSVAARARGGGHARERHARAREWMLQELRNKCGVGAGWARLLTLSAGLRLEDVAPPPCRARAAARRACAGGDAGRRAGGGAGRGGGRRAA
jgi:hypothetical protein